MTKEARAHLHIKTMMQLQSKQLWTSVIFMLLFVHGKAEGEYAFVEGDVIIAGLFDIQTEKGGQCKKINIDSVMTLEAIRWYINQLNDNGALPFKLGFKGYNTCGPPGKAVETALDVIYQHEGENLLGFLSLLSNEKERSVSSVLSSTLTDNRYIQISMAAASNELKKRNEYPNFYRVIPDDSKQLKTIILLMKKLRWNRIGIIYENNTNGRNLAFSLQEFAKQNAICVSKVAGIKTSVDGDVYSAQIQEAIVDVLLFVPLIEGIVYFGSETVANQVLQRSENELSHADLPLFILSGTVGLDEAVFHSVGSKPPLTKTRGALVVTPAYTNIISFNDYWLSLFTNLAHIKEKAASNPWLYDIFASKSNTKCNPISKNCIPLTLREAMTKFKLRALHVQYGLIAVHAMTKAIQQAFNIHCKADYIACASTLKPHNLMDEMNTVVIDFGTDFNVSVEPLTTSGYKMSFGDYADATLLSDDDVTQVYNFRQHSTGDFGLLKVGSLRNNGELDLNVSALKDYKSDGTETSYPDWRKGQCPVKKRCSECIAAEDIPEQHIIIPGDVYVIGIAPVYNKGSDQSECGDIYLEGYEIARALQYGLEIFNSRQEYTEYRSKFGINKIGLVILNSCRNDIVIIRKILNMHRYGIDLGDGKSEDISERILGYIGAFTSDISLRVAETLKEMNQVQISYSSTTPILSDNERYPHFLRVVPPDDAQAQAIIQIIKQLGGEYIQVIYVEKEYGEGALEYLKSSAGKQNICIAQEIVVKQTENYNQYYERIRNEPDAKIIILFLHHPILVQFMQALSKKSQAGTYQFIASDGWGKHNDLLDVGLSDGVITVALEMKKVEGLIPYMQSEKISAYHSNIWLEQYLQKRHDCFFDFSFDKTYGKRCINNSNIHTMTRFPGDDWSNFATISVLSLLMGSAELYSKHCRRENGLCAGFTANIIDLVDEIKNVSMDILGDGETKLFNDKGDGNIGYSIYNIQKNIADNNALTYVKVGKFDLQKGLFLDVTQLKPPLGKKIESPCPSELACKDCLKQIPPDLGQMNVSQDTLKSNPSSNIVIIALASTVGVLGLALIVVFSAKLVQNLKKRKPGTEYITPVDVGGTTNRGADNYHDILLHEETRY